MSDNIFVENFVRYISEELAHYDDELAKMTDEQIRDWLLGELLPSGTRIFPIFADEKEIGFVILGLKGQNCHPLCDAFIIHAYVLPEFRKIGYMSNTLHSIFKEYKGVFCYDVLNRNETGKHFWGSFVKKNNFPVIDLEEVRDDPGDITLYAFEVRV